MTMQLQQIAVAGAGQMGSGIAQVCAQSGMSVTLYDVEEAAIKRGLSLIERSLARQLSKGKLTAERKSLIVQRITATTDFTQLGRAALVIEAAPEQLAIKTTIFRELDELCPEGTILASNTSSLPITALAAATRRADRVIGLHFMNPVPVMPLVEVVRGLATSEETYRQAKELVAALGKTAVTAKDCPGFAANRILMPMINEAAFAVYEGIASPEDIDLVMKLGMNHPMGPLALADFIGLDTCLAIMETLQAGFADSKYRPCPLLRSYVQAGWLGRKTGRGFYRYAREGDADGA
jgi:3-hydroxybutyryl-CoA dehydrogenase